MSRLVTGPVVLVVLDGWGWREDINNNGIAMAKTPVFDELVKNNPFTLLEASGEAVGLPDGQIGNSEVGHTAIGAGRVIYQDLVRIGKDMKSGGVLTNVAFKKVFTHVESNNSRLHVMGILSGGGVHGHEDHVLEIIKQATEKGLDVVVHVFLDGRDTPRTSGIESLKRLEDFCANRNCVIGSVMGRYFAMDRDTNWERTEKAYKAIFNGEAEQIHANEVSPSLLVQEKYHSDKFDEHLEPIVFKGGDVKNGDGIIFTNFRSDRARQLSEKVEAVIEEKNICFVTMTNYGNTTKALIAYTPELRGETLGEIISKNNMKQLRLAETEKFPHATYFLNGGVEIPHLGEDDVVIPSRKDVKTHDEAPEMRAVEIADEAVKRMKDYDFVFINFANPDMVGHTANQKAIITAVETVDTQLGRVVGEVRKNNGAMVIIADHGNAEIMVDPITGEPHTAHTTSLVPCILFGVGERKNISRGGLVDVAPTVLTILGLNTPSSMTGQDLI